MKLPALVAIAFLCLPEAVQAQPNSDIPQWYGTIRFSKTLARHSDDPLEFQGQPGKKFSDVKVTWSGSIKFIPGDKAVVVARYTFRRELDRREDKMNACHWKTEKTAFHDYETQLEETQVNVNREENNRLQFRLQADGSYRTSLNVNGGNHVPKATKYRTLREIYSECTKPPLDRKPQQGDGSAGMESVRLNHIEGKVKPGATTLTGKWSVEDDDGGKLSYSWDLTLAPPELVARAKATPSPVIRGESVTLDAKASTGKIDKYEWQFTPDGDCKMPKEGLALKLTGASVTFKVLCDFTAELTVSNAKTSDRASQPVVVEARKGDAWTTKFESQPGPTFTERILPEHIFAGKNRCTLDPAGSDLNHLIHTTSPNNSTWRDVGYVLAQASDPGPFKGAWYVQSQTLKINRHERVNGEILAGSAIYKANVAKGNQKAIDDWGAQAKAHEAAHSVLVEEKLKMLGPDGDAAARIEKLVGPIGESALQTEVDVAVGDVNTALMNATLEDKVADRLRSESRFRSDANIWFPGASSTKNLGPFWKLGH